MHWWLSAARAGIPLSYRTGSFHQDNTKGIKMEEKKSRGSREETGDSPSRRVFLQRAAGTGFATVAGVALLQKWSRAQGPFDYIRAADDARVGPAAEPGLSANDRSILNYALTLERLEAQFYNLNADKPYLITSPPGTSLQSLLVSGEEVPQPVNTPATGVARFTLSQDQTQLFYDVRITTLGGGDATAMHIHRGGRGVAGDVVYPLNTPVGGVSMGVVQFNPADVDALFNQGLYLNVHSAGFPAGEIRGQLITTPEGAFPATTMTLKSMVDEIRDHENAHVALLEQTLGASAAPAPTFQNLDAPTLQQFLTMAQTFEDVGVSAYLGQISAIQSDQIHTTAGAIMAVEARHAGGIRAYRKVASTAEGGDPNTTLSEDREALNRSRTRDQVLALIAPFIVGSATIG
jgi:hypothetical protein